MKRKQKKLKSSVSVEDYLKTVKKTDREVALSFRPGWAAKVKIHTSKKTYNRKDKSLPEE
jgi:hypothetical protein